MGARGDVTQVSEKFFGWCEYNVGAGWFLFQNTDNYLVPFSRFSTLTNFMQLSWDGRSDGEALEIQGVNSICKKMEFWKEHYVSTSKKFPQTASSEKGPKMHPKKGS